MFSGVALLSLCAVAFEVKRELPEGGVILWSYGRSATGTFAGSVADAAEWQFCNGEKESFKRHPLSARALRDCFDRDERFAHLKPQHLMHSDSELRNSTYFFRAARQAGYDAVAAVYRDNALNRELSSFELTTKHEKLEERYHIAEDFFCRRDLVHDFLEMKKIWELGVEDARDAGFVILQLRFTDVVDRVCESVDKILTLASPSTNEGEPECVPFESSHVLTSHHDLTMEGRVGPVAYSCIEKQLKDEPNFAWMLQPGAETPPHFD